MNVRLGLLILLALAVILLAWTTTPPARPERLSRRFLRYPNQDLTDAFANRLKYEYPTPHQFMFAFF